MSYLLDTCILSKLRRIQKYPDKKLEAWITSHSETQYFISVLTIGEIQSGISKLDIGIATKKKEKMILENWLMGELIPRFEGRILDVDKNVATRWGNLIGSSQAKGIQIPAIDSLLAATALEHNFILVTENVKDFQYAGIEIFNPCSNSK